MNICSINHFVPLIFKCVAVAGAAAVAVTVATAIAANKAWIFKIFYSHSYGILTTKIFLSNLDK